MAKITLTGVGNLTLEVRDKEFLALAGPAGSGKSAALRMIAGLDKISSGEIQIGERRVNDLPPKDRETAMIFRADALYPAMSVRENIAFGLKMRKYPKAEIQKRVGEAAGILGIEQLLERKPDALSEPERRRVALGRAMARQPKVFLFDEPLFGLDARARAEMRAEITKLHKRLQATILYATREQEDAMTMADTIAVMKDGAVEQADAPMALYASPRNLFVAGFAGSPSMNFIHGKLKETPEGVLFKENGGSIECRFNDRPTLKTFSGKEVILGIRPEHIAVAKEPVAAGKGAFQAVVDFVEPAGAGTTFHVQTGAHTVVCRSESGADHGDEGRRMRFEMNLAKAHFFDPATTARVA